MTSVINALIRAEGSVQHISPEFEQVRPDLDIAVIELSCDVPVTAWEAEVVAMIEKVDMTVTPNVDYVIFVETSGDPGVLFSSSLLTNISRIGASLEHYHRGE